MNLIENNVQSGFGSVDYFLARGHAFHLNCSCCVFLSKSPVSSYFSPLSKSRRLGKKSLILFTPGVSGQQPPTTPRPVCLLVASMCERHKYTVRHNKASVYFHIFRI